ncbi:hypothetical protein [Sphaerotilus sp.]|uniref:hypothetical protein n=1 Tax=Sphaerotilus sp. TaxID=2093942 RepID=UPI0025D75001|nr:hypothetical protein [Sphaerotilus sp.]
MCPAPGNPEALPFDILASVCTLQPGRSAGRADPVAFVPVLACGRRSCDHASTQPDHQHNLVQPGQRRHHQHPARPRRRAGRVPGQRQHAAARSIGWPA